MDAGVAVVLAAIVVTIPPLVTALAARKILRKADLIHQETLRIKAILPADRTVAEQHHLDTSPDA